MQDISVAFDVVDLLEGSQLLGSDQHHHQDSVASVCVCVFPRSHLDHQHGYTSPGQQLGPVTFDFHGATQDAVVESNEAKRQGLQAEWAPGRACLVSKYFRMVATEKIMETPDVATEATWPDAAKLLFDLEPKVDEDAIRTARTFLLNEPVRAMTVCAL